MGLNDINTSGGNITLNAAGDINIANVVNSSGGNIDITTGNFLRTRGSFTNINNVEASISSASGASSGGSIIIRHQGSVTTPFIIGDATTLGTTAAINSGSETISPSFQVAVPPDTYNQGNITIITPAPPEPVGAPTPTLPPENLGETTPATTEPQPENPPIPVPSGSASPELPETSLPGGDTTEAPTETTTEAPTETTTEAPTETTTEAPTETTTEAPTETTTEAPTETTTEAPTETTTEAPTETTTAATGSSQTGGNTVSPVPVSSPDAPTINYISETVEDSQESQNQFTTDISVATSIATDLQGSHIPPIENVEPDLETDNLTLDRSIYPQRIETRVQQLSEFNRDNLQSLNLEQPDLKPKTTELAIEPEAILAAVQSANFGILNNAITEVALDEIFSQSDLEASVWQIEQYRNQEFEEHLGVKAPIESQAVTIPQFRETLTRLNSQTGKKSAIIYIIARNEQLEIVLFAGEGDPVRASVPEAKRATIFPIVNKLRGELTNPRKRNSTSYLAQSQQLYKWLIAPIEATLLELGIDTLLFSLDAGLRSLPMSALHDGQQFLIEKYSLALIPSFALVDTNYRTIKQAQVLAMGASEFIDNTPLPAVPVELATITNELGKGQFFLGNFALFSTPAVGTVPTWVAVEDFNGDSNLDLAVANGLSNNISVLLGNGAGGFGPQTTFAAGNGPTSIAVGDFSGDGNLDLAATNYSGGNVSLLLGDGAGNFGSQTTYAVGTQPGRVVNGDFNNDGSLDLAVTNQGSNNVSILLRRPIVSITPGITPTEAGPVNGTFNITLDTPAPIGGLTVNFNLTGSTATLTTDYSFATGTNITAVTANTFTIAAGATSATLTVVPVDNNIDNDPENLTTSLSPPLSVPRLTTPVLML